MPKPISEVLQKSVEKILGEPIILRLDDELAKTRFRLLAVSTLAVAIVAADLHIKPGSSLLGLNIENLNDNLVRTGLAIITGYLLVHFLWGVADGFREWRLRLTGSRYTADTLGGFGGRSPYGDLPRDPRYSTLYSWWKERAAGFSKIEDLVEQLDKAVTATQLTQTEVLRRTCAISLLHSIKFEKPWIILAWCCLSNGSTQHFPCWCVVRICVGSSSIVLCRL